MQNTETNSPNSSDSDKATPCPPGVDPTDEAAKDQLRRLDSFAENVPAVMISDTDPSVALVAQVQMDYAMRLILERAKKAGNGAPTKKKVKRVCAMGRQLAYLMSKITESQYGTLTALGAFGPKSPGKRRHVYQPSRL